MKVNALSPYMYVNAESHTEPKHFVKYSLEECNDLRYILKTNIPLS